MELKELCEKTKEIFEISDISELPGKLFEVCINNEYGYMDSFCNIIPDLSVDWMQMIFQYYEADRKEKMQDYTPKSLADFMGRLAGEPDTVIDMCAGSGALTIQKWNRDNGLKFKLYELDEKVIPYLLFNMAVRNIDCTVYHADVLQMEVSHTYRVSKGDRFGICKEVPNEHNINL